jgi:hypothetical protein
VSTLGTSIDALRLRAVMGRDAWAVPEPFGSDGWVMARRDGAGSVIVTCASVDGAEWLHASIAGRDRLPTYHDLVRLHHAVWGTRGYAFQVFAPTKRHVNIHEHALHLWGRLDGVSPLPDFGMYGTI